MKCPDCGRAVVFGDDQQEADDDFEIGDEPSPPARLPPKRSAKRARRTGAAVEKSPRREGSGLSSVVAVAASLLHVCTRPWLIAIAIVGGLAAAVYFNVPGMGGTTYFTVEKFEEHPELPSGFIDGTEAGVIVTIHNTPAGDIRERLVTRREMTPLNGNGRFESFGSLIQRGTAQGPEGPVTYEIAWQIGDGVTSVTVDGKPISRAFLE